MLVEKAIADAYGARFEFKKDSFIQEHNTPSKGYFGKPPARYTDDTQMEIALAELMLSGKDPDQWTLNDLASAFFIVFKRDPRNGYARGFQSVLERVEGPWELISTLWPHSQRNGAAMRVGCIGLYDTPYKVIDLAMFQASLTHGTQEGFYSAAGAALLVHAMYHNDCSKFSLDDYLEHYVPLPRRFAGWHHNLHKGRVDLAGVSTVRAAMTAVMASKTTSEVLKACVGFGGDTDTVAAIAMSAASVSSQIEQDLPETLYRNLENGTYGRDFLTDLDQKLFKAFPKNDTEDGEDDSSKEEVDDLSSWMDLIVED